VSSGSSRAGRFNAVISWACESRKGLGRGRAIRRQGTGSRASLAILEALALLRMKLDHGGGYLLRLAVGLSGFGNIHEPCNCCRSDEFRGNLASGLVFAAVGIFGLAAYMPRSPPGLSGGFRRLGPA
jgi:hypothetical protein